LTPTHDAELIIDAPGKTNAKAQRCKDAKKIKVDGSYRKSGEIIPSSSSGLIWTQSTTEKAQRSTEK
jgi:hypothetical protein